MIRHFLKNYHKHFQDPIHEYVLLPRLYHNFTYINFTAIDSGFFKLMFSTIFSRT